MKLCDNYILAYFQKFVNNLTHIFQKFVNNSTPAERGFSVFCEIFHYIFGSRVRFLRAHKKKARKFGRLVLSSGQRTFVGKTREIGLA